ncbi:MAG TPA: cyclic nucleotide-binding domain-containing protein [Actinomycetota bacterium]|nr:cyclic nucleotide-binding domain-containing protein [Actinomycetota bacterium]
MEDERLLQVEGGFRASLNAEERAALDSLGRRRTFRRGQSLLSEGATSDRVIVVLEGRVKVSYFTEDGKEVLLAVRVPGGLLG